jgi:hypothetical protein
VGAFLESYFELIVEYEQALVMKEFVEVVVIDSEVDVLSVPL